MSISKASTLTGSMSNDRAKQMSVLGREPQRRTLPRRRMHTRTFKLLSQMQRLLSHQSTKETASPSHHNRHYSGSETLSRDDSGIKVMRNFKPDATTCKKCTEPKKQIDSQHFQCLRFKWVILNSLGEKQAVCDERETE